MASLMQMLIAQRFQKFDRPSSMDVVTDTRYIRCFWPKLDAPTALFALGSSGIEVIGPPTPRNVLFPADTVFPEVYLDAASAAERAVRTKWPWLTGLINLTSAQAAVYMEAYEAKSATMPAHATKMRTRKDCH